jgi:hypothetical protein
VQGFQNWERDIGDAEVANGAGGNVGLERAPGFEGLRQGAQGGVEDYAVEVGCVVYRFSGLVGVGFDGAEVLQGGGDGLADLVCDGSGGVVRDVVGIVGVDGGEFGLDLGGGCLARCIGHLGIQHLGRMLNLNMRRLNYIQTVPHVSPSPPR